MEVVIIQQLKAEKGRWSQSPVVRYVLNYDVVAWIQQQQECVFSISSNSQAHSAIVCLFSFQHQAPKCMQAGTHSHAHTPSSTHPHDHPEQHYHNLGELDYP